MRCWCGSFARCFDVDKSVGSSSRGDGKDDVRWRTAQFVDEPVREGPRLTASQEAVHRGEQEPERKGDSGTGLVVMALVVVGLGCVVAGVVVKVAQRRGAGWKELEMRVEAVSTKPVKAQLGWVPPGMEEQAKEEAKEWMEEGEVWATAGFARSEEPVASVT